MTTEHPHVSIDDTSAMDALDHYLRHLAEHPLGCVLHIGAGSGAVLDSYRALQAQRLLLIEGDPEAYARLSTRPERPARAEVLEAVIGADARQVLWHRYSLPTLNGPLDAGGWIGAYPRLRLESTLARQTYPLQSILEQGLEGTDGSAPNMLVLDVAGQEAALLSSVSPDTLRRFEWVLVRGCGQAPAPGWTTAATAVAELEAAGYVVQPGATGVDPLDADPIWPVFALRFDAQAHRLRELEAQVHELLALSQTQVQQLDEQRKLSLSYREEVEVALARAQAAESALADQRAAAERAQVQATEATTRHAAIAEEQHRMAQDLRTELEQAREAMTRQQAGLEGLQSQLDSLRQSKAAADQAAIDHAALITALERTAAEQAAALDAANKGVAEQTKLANDRRNLTEALTKDKAQVTAERDALLREKVDLVTARDAQAKVASDHAARITNLETASAEQAAALDAANRSLAEQTKVASERRALNEALTKDKAQAIAERDALAKEKAALVAARDEQTRAARDAKRRGTTLEAELADINARYGLLQEELIKAEAQVELIADLLLRDPRP